MKQLSVLVTGASGTIGRAITSDLLAHGHTVRAHYFSSLVPLTSLQNCAGLSLHQADLRCSDQVRRLFAEAAPLDALIHTAAVAADGLVARTSHQQWQDVLQLNLHGSFRVIQQALHFLPDGGRILLLGSRVGEHGNRGQAAYAASKAALHALARSAAREGAARRITVNVICPPFIPSKMGNDANDQRKEQRLLEMSSEHSLAAVTSLTRWLLSDAAAAVTGQILHPDQRIGFS